MEIIFLGSGSALPTRERMLSSMVINREGENYLFDCGESTQFQIAAAAVKPFKIKNIFITHLHGDHVFGLPGLISSMSLLKSTEPINIFGPEGIKEFMEVSFRISNMNPKYEVLFKEIPTDFKGGVIFQNNDVVVSAIPLEHTIFTLGYRFQEKNQPGHLDMDRAKEFGLPLGPLVGELKKGNTVVVNGKTIYPDDVLTEDIKGKSVCYITDTKYCQNAIEISKEADVLIHEATFEAALGDKAKEMLHSTTLDAALAAKEANAKLLIITHISSRNEDIDKLVEECLGIFSNTIAADDFLRMEV